MLAVCISTCKVLVLLEQPEYVSHACWQVWLGANGFGYEKSLQLVTDVE